MGGLKLDIVDGIRIFAPKTLKDAVNLARARDEQIARRAVLLDSKTDRRWIMPRIRVPSQDLPSTPTSNLAIGRRRSLRVSQITRQDSLIPVHDHQGQNVSVMRRCTVVDNKVSALIVTHRIPPLTATRVENYG
ncbi:unnamed protein product [Linum trigynum]|uniref:Uncharacterized protein n=1 Tax=Linum trigynum TaxID=586398 RepID=A0AAV2FQP1_9ROSI